MNGKIPISPLTHEWIECEVEMPPERHEGIGTVSEKVEVELSDGRMSKDWLLNGKWVVHCKNNGGAYPVRWKWSIQ